MKNKIFQQLIYQLVSKLLVWPIYKFVFKGHLIGSENIPQKDSFIMVSNHGSLLDPPLLGHAIGRNISFMAKSELFKIPLLGSVIKACGAYPVKRGIVDRNTIQIACKKLSNNNCIGIFIDGTRQKNGRVNKPKQGAALLAFKNQKVLLPVAIVNSHKLIRFKFCIPLFSKLVIKVGKPITPPQSASREELSSVTIHLQNNINYLIG
jgi:1-acyl-sn-glycerol-3-phosphate acyltransferase